MDPYIRPPEPLSETGNVYNNWQEWKKDFIIFLKATEYCKKENEVQAYLLKTQIGKIGQDAMKKIAFKKPEDKDNIDVLLQKLEEYFNPKKNILVERYNFFKTSYKEKETIEDHVNDLREKAKTCNFGHLTESLIRDKVILNLYDKVLREKLLKTEDLTLTKLLLICKVHKNTTQEKANASTKSTNTIDKKDKDNTSTAGNNGSTTKPSEQNEQLKYKTMFKKNCYKCNQKHELRSCPAWGFKCEKCNRLHHYTNCCKQVFQDKYKANMNADRLNRNPNIQTESQRNNCGQTNWGTYPTPPPKNPYMSPSAPPLAAVNSLYPNIYRMENSETQSNINERYNFNQGYVKTHETFQNTTPPVQSRNVPDSPRNVPNTEAQTTPTSTIPQNALKNTAPPVQPREFPNSPRNVSNTKAQTTRTVFPVKTKDENPCNIS